MADIAQLGFAADTGGLVDAKVALDALVPSATKVDKSSAKLASSLAKVDASADKLMAAAVGLVSAVDKMSAGLDRSGKAATVAAAAQGQVAASTVKMTVSFGGVTKAATAAASSMVDVASSAGVGASGLSTVGAAAVATDAKLEQLDAHMTAFRANLRQMKIDAMAAGGGFVQQDAHMMAYRTHLDGVAEGAKKAGAAIKFTAQDSLNATRQLADIGVTAAMGMSPFMIAIQQGPQLLDILQNKAATTGQSLGQVFKAAGAAAYAAILPLLPYLVLIGLAVGAVAAAFGLATREISKGNEDISKGLGLTEKQLERLKKSGVDTGVTIGDTFTALGQVIGERLSTAFDGPLSTLSNVWNSFLDNVTKGAVIWIKWIIGGFAGAAMAIKASWKMLPAALGDLTYSAANKVIGAVEFMINKSIDGINTLIGFANAAAAKVGLEGMGTIGKVSLGKMNNPFAGIADQAGSAMAEGFSKAKASSDKAVDRFFADVGNRARSNRKKLILEAAGDAAKGAGGAKGGKSDGAKFSDIVTGAEADIATQRARATAVDLSAEAAATLEQKTKLLNEAQSKGITLTGAMRTKIDELAAAYGKAKVAADDAIALKAILKTADADIAGLKSQAELIGLTGRQLAYQTQMQKLLNDAKAKGLTVDAAMRKTFEGKANEYADQSASNDKTDFMTGVDAAAKERMILLGQERAAIGLNIDQTRKLAIENDLLAQARQKNIDLSPADLAAIGQVATEQAAAEAAIRKTRETLEFAKGTTKDFFKDIFNGLREGKSLWQSFGDAAVGALNKIVDRLMDKALTSLVDSLFSSLTGGGGGGLFSALFSAKGNTFDNGVTPYAKGGTFTNSVVDKATMFASGGMLGVMGEAGPEAIMPLKRGSDGSLGVQMHGGDQGGGGMSVSVTVKNDNRVTGAVSSQDIIELQRRSAEQTKAQLKREIPQVIQAYQRDGAIV